jgi:hypothetical protein
MKTTPSHSLSPTHIQFPFRPENEVQIRLPCSVGWMKTGVGGGGLYSTTLHSIPYAVAMDRLDGREEQEDTETDGQEDKRQRRQVDMTCVHIVPSTRLKMHNAPISVDDFDSRVQLGVGRTNISKHTSCSRMYTMKSHCMLKYYIILLNSR